MPKSEAARPTPISSKNNSTRFGLAFFFLLVFDFVFVLVLSTFLSLSTPWCLFLVYPLAFTLNLPFTFIPNVILTPTLTLSLTLTVKSVKRNSKPGLPCISSKTNSTRLGLCFSSLFSRPFVFSILRFALLSHYKLIL